MPDWFAANAPKQDDWFSANAPNPSPSLSSDSEETRGEMRGSARKREDSGSDWFDANQPPKIKPYRMPVKDDMGSAAVGAISSAINAAGPGRSASGAATFQPVNPNPKVEYAPHLKAQQGKTWNAPTAPPMVLPEPDIQPLVPAKLAAEEFINPSKPVVAAGHGGTVSSAQPIKATPSDENIGQVLAGAATGTGKFVEGLITPENVAIGAMMMLPGVAPAATTYFTFDMMKSAVEQAPEVLAKWKAGDKKGAVEAAVQVAGSAYFAKKGTEHLAKQARPAIERLTQKMEPLVTKPPALTTPMADRYPNQEFIPGDKGADAAPPKPKSAQGSFATFMRDQKRETVVPEEGIPESQARAQAAREDAALETTGPVPPMAEPPAPPWAPPAPEQRSTVAPRPMPPPLGMPPAAEYRALRQSAQRGVENIDAVRALRDEAMRKPVETNPFVMKPAAESAEVFKNQPIPGEGSAAESAQAFQSQIQPTGRPVPGRPPELKTPVDPMAAKNEMARAVAGKDYKSLTPDERVLVDKGLAETKTAPKKSVLQKLDATGKAAQERIRAKGSVTSMNDFLNPETIRDYAQSIAGDIARGALTVERFVADMVAKHGPAVKEHAQRIWAEAQRFANDIGGEDTVTMPAVKKVVDKFKKDERPIEEQYLNFDRIRVSPAEEAALRSEYQAQSANGTLLPKETIPMVDIHGAAAGVTPGQIKAKSAQSMDYVGNNAVTMAARQRQLALGREFSQTVAEYERTKSGMSTEQREAAEARIDEYRGNLHAYNNVLEPLRKQAGLGLRVWRDLADSTWDASFWMRQAKDAKGIPSDRTLPKSVENQIGKLVGEGQAAQQAVDQGLRESGYSVEMEAKLKAAQEKAKQFIDKNQGNPALQAQLAEAQKQFRNAREQYQRMLVKREQMLTNLPQLKQHAVNLKNAKVRIAKEMAAMEKDGFLELTSAAIKAIPLLGLKTHERNIAGTVLNTHIAEPLKSLPVAIVDATRTAFGYQKGRETTAVTPRMYWNALEHQFSKTGGRGEAVEVFKHGARKQDIASGDWQRELNFQKDWIPESVSRNINAFVNTTFRVLSAEDRFNKSFAIQLALERQAKAHAINEARQWLIRKTEIKTRMTELVSSPTPEMEMNAILYGDMATYNNKNKMAQGVNQIRASLNPVVRTFGFDPIIRYIRTPMNVAMTAIQLNPVVGPAISIGKAVALKHQVGKARKSLRADIKEGLEPEGIALREKDIADFKAKLTPEVNRAYAEALGRGAVGSAITLLGWYLADQGLLTGYDAGATPADRGRMDVTDRPAASIFIGGKWRKISAFAPVVSPLLMAATLYQMWKEDSRKVKANPGSAVSKAVWSTAAGWMDLPMNTGIKTVSDAFKSPESLDKKAISYVKATVGSLIPPIATELDKAMTPNKKATVGAEFQSRVPGARGKLPDGLDAFGRTTPESKWVMVDAFDSTAPKTDHLSNEMDRLKVGVTKLNRGTIFTLTTANGERMEFETQREMQDVADEYAHAGEQVKAGAYEEPEDRLRARQQIVGTLMRELGHVAVTDPDYAGMTDNEKRKQIEQAFRESRGEMSKIMRDPRFGAMSKPEQIKILSDLVKDLSQ